MSREPDASWSSGASTAPEVLDSLDPGTTVDEQQDRSITFWGGPRDGEIVPEHERHVYGIFYKGGCYRPRLATGLFLWIQHVPPRAAFDIRPWEPGA